MNTSIPCQQFHKPKKSNHRQQDGEMKNAGFMLTKFVSNEPNVLAEISSDEKNETKGIKSVHCQKWNITSNYFAVIPLKQFPKDATVYTQNIQFGTYLVILSLIQTNQKK